MDTNHFIDDCFKKTFREEMKVIILVIECLPSFMLNLVDVLVFPSV